MSDNYKVLIISSYSEHDITQRLYHSAVNSEASKEVTFTEEVFPNVFDIPVALSVAIASEMHSKKPHYDGYLLLGCVMRSKTPYFDIITQDSTRAITDLSLTNKIALGNGILHVETERHALRILDNEPNRGADAAVAVLKMIKLRKEIEESFTLSNV